jgi:hypothetical protein
MQAPVRDAPQHQRRERNTWPLKRYETGRFETAAMRFTGLEFLRQWP